MFGKLGDMAGLMKQAQEMQNNLKRIKEELKKSRYSAEVNGVKVTVDGEMEVKELEITVQMDNRKMADSVKQAVNKSLKVAREDAANKLKSATGGLSLPGM